jgi:hypothetical protein
MLQPLDREKAEEALTQSSKMKKDLKEAFELAAEEKPLSYYKGLIVQNREALAREQEREVARVRSAAAAVAKAKRARSDGDGDLDMPDEEPEEDEDAHKKSKKRKAEEATGVSGGGGWGLWMTGIADTPLCRRPSGRTRSRRPRSS